MYFNHKDFLLIKNTEKYSETLRKNKQKHIPRQNPRIILIQNRLNKWFALLQKVGLTLTESASIATARAAREILLTLDSKLPASR